MNLNTALMSHLQKPPIALKIILITFTVHPTFLFAFNLDLLQGLQAPSPRQGFPNGPSKGSGRLVIHGRTCCLQRHPADADVIPPEGIFGIALDL